MVSSGSISLVLPGLVLVACLLGAGCAGPFTQTPGAERAIHSIDPLWNLTVVGDRTVVLNYSAILSLPAVTGHGFSVSTVGIKNGPHLCKGVLLPDLLSLAGQMGDGDEVWIHARDGYLWVLGAKEVRGEGFVTFTEDLNETPHGPLQVILMYEQDGAPLSDQDGGPLRLAIVSAEPGFVTQGSTWVKWVNRIEIKHH